MTEIEKALTATGHEKLTEALALAQAEMKNAPLNKVNPHFKNKYADLASIRDATIPALAKHGIAITQRCMYTEGGAYLLVTRLAHKSGGYIESEYPLPTSATPQALGSALTYGRRYTWAALCGIASEEDDDAETAEKGNVKTTPKAPPPAEKPAVGNMAEVPKWRGPMKVTELKATLKNIGRVVEACSDMDELMAYLTQTEIVEPIEQAKIDLAGWWFGVGDSDGLQGLIERRKAALRENEMLTERA